MLEEKMNFCPIYTNYKRQAQGSAGGAQTGGGGLQVVHEAKAVGRAATSADIKHDMSRVAGVIAGSGAGAQCFGGNGGRTGVGAWRQSMIGSFNFLQLNAPCASIKQTKITIVDFILNYSKSTFLE